VQEIETSVINTTSCAKLDFAGKQVGCLPLMRQQIVMPQTCQSLTVNQVIFALFVGKKCDIFQHWLGGKGDTQYSSSVPTTFGWDCSFEGGTRKYWGNEFVKNVLSPTRLNSIIKSAQKKCPQAFARL